ncbi:MAG: YoaK family protein [Roseiarcus sp.]
MKLTLPFLLSVNAGYVDTAGFLTLQGLFTAHVTGNFVTFGAAIVLGTSGAVAKLLALPVFCATVVLIRLLGYFLAARGLPQLRILLVLKLLFLIAGCALAIALGPFANGDGWRALITGMVLVCAMAIQNAAQRIYLPSSPPTTLMTGNTTQIMIDIVDLLRGVPQPQRDATRARLWRMSAAVLGFAAGCGAAALFCAFLHVWCFIVPPVLGVVAALLRIEAAPASPPVKAG